MPYMFCLYNVQCALSCGPSLAPCRARTAMTGAGYALFVYTGILVYVQYVCFVCVVYTELWSLFSALLRTECHDGCVNAGPCSSQPLTVRCGVAWRGTWLVAHGMGVAHGSLTRRAMQQPASQPLTVCVVSPCTQHLLCLLRHACGMSVRCGIACHMAGT